MFTGLQDCWNGRPLGTFKRMNHEGWFLTVKLHQSPRGQAHSGGSKLIQKVCVVLGPAVRPRISCLWCSEVLSDLSIFSIKFMFLSVVVKAPCHLAIPYVLRFAHFYLHCISANLATPECTWFLPMNVILFLFAVICWDWPSLLLPVPAQFKELSFLKAFSWAKIDSPSPMPLILWWFHFMH